MAKEKQTNKAGFTRRSLQTVRAAVKGKTPNGARYTAGERIGSAGLAILEGGAIVHALRYIRDTWQSNYAARTDIYARTESIRTNVAPETRNTLWNAKVGAMQFLGDANNWLSQAFGEVVRGDPLANAVFWGALVAGGVAAVKVHNKHRSAARRFYVPLITGEKPAYLKDVDEPIDLREIKEFRRSFKQNQGIWETDHERGVMLYHDTVSPQDFKAAVSAFNKRYPDAPLRYQIVNGVMHLEADIEDGEDVINYFIDCLRPLTVNDRVNDYVSFAKFITRTKVREVFGKGVTDKALWGLQKEGNIYAIGDDIVVSGDLKDLAVQPPEVRKEAVNVFRAEIENGYEVAVDKEYKNRVLNAAGAMPKTVYHRDANVLGGDIVAALL